MSLLQVLLRDATIAISLIVVVQVLDVTCLVRDVLWADTEFSCQEVLDVDLFILLVHQTLWLNCLLSEWTVFEFLGGAE